MPTPTRVLCAVALVVILPDVADAQSRVRLDYRAPAACPDASELIAAVAARLGSAPFVADDVAGTATLDVLIVPVDPEGWLGTVALDDGEIRASRRTDCDSLVRALAGDAAEALAPPSPPESEPAEDAARTSRPPPPPGPTDDAPVQVTADQAGLTLYAARRAGRWNALVDLHEFERLCTAPCRTTLRRGMHHLAVGRGTGGAISIDELVPVSGSSVLELSYDDRSATRRWGVGLLVAGGVAVLTSLVWAVALGDNADPSEVVAPIAIGIGGAVSVLVGEILALVPPSATVRVRPH